MRSCLLALILTVIALFEAERAHGFEVMVIGNEENPWGEMGTLENVDDATDPGWIQPRRTESTENLSLEALERNGGMSTPQPSVRAAGDLNAMIDGDPNTIFDGSKARQVGGMMILDLGAIFGGVERIQFYPSPSASTRFLRGYEVWVNDGSAEMRVGGVLQWQLVEKEDKNENSTVRIRIPSQYVRYIKLVFTTPLPWEIAELEVYSRGFVPRAIYTSKVIDLGDLANFGQLYWAQQEQPRASVSIFSRTGSTPDPNRYFQLVRKGLEIERVEVSQKEFERLDADERERVLDTENWSPWSPEYAVPSGEQIAVSAPRRYFQFKCEFASEFFNQGAKLDSLAFEYSTPPVARFVRAEIAPQKVTAGEPSTFTYVVRAKIEGNDTGFDALEIATPSRVEVRGLKIGGIPVEDYIPEVEEGRVVVRFPDHRIMDTTPVELSFDGAVLVYGTRFAGKIFDTKTTELPQPITEGDTSSELASDRLSVAVTLSNVLVKRVSVSPNPFTPNGDGINEVTTIGYQILKLAEEVPVSVSIYDLSGRRVRDLYSGTAMSGIYPVRYEESWDGLWDGLDDSGRLVAPGLYLCRISVSADTGEGDSVVPIAVVY